ncbi:putative plastidic glucose transporter 2 isoform X2 [Wolffia australiana]
MIARLLWRGRSRNDFGVALFSDSLTGGWNWKMLWKFRSSVHKRMSSKEMMSVDGGDTGDGDVSARLRHGNEKDCPTPPWKFSLPHVCVAVLSSFLFGYHIGVVNEPLERISHDVGFGGDTMAEGLVVSVCLGGAFLGCMFSGWIADGVGRRRAFQLSSLPMIIGASISASTTNLQGMLLGRFLVGTGMGLGPPTASLYVTEISPSYLRGTYGSFIQIATCLGLIVAQFMGIPVKNIPGWWRLCFWVSIVPAALLLLLMEFCVESPHWLFKCGRVADAEFEFERLLGEAHASEAIAELSYLNKEDDTESVTFSELLCGRYNAVVSTGAALFALQQMSGINAVFFFSSSVFKTAGVPSAPANICIGFSNLAGSIAAMLMMDRLGRKFLLMGSFLAMAGSMGLQVAASSFPSYAPWSVYLSVFGMIVFVLSFALGAGPVPGLLLPEIFPSRIRAKAMALCMCVHWVVNFFVGLLFLRLMEQLGPPALYSIFGLACFFAVVFVKKKVMETKAGE